MSTNQEKLQRVQHWLGEQTIGVYYGIETVNWSIRQFDAAAQHMRSMGVDVMFIKFGQGGYEWYNGEVKTIRTHLTAMGLGCAPFYYCLPRMVEWDLPICIKLATINGGIVLDCEDEFVHNGVELYNLVHGIRAAVPDACIIVSGYGDPLSQFGPHFSFDAIADADAYQPQLYIGWWDPYRFSGWQFAIDWGINQCMKEFIRTNLTVDFPITPAINVQGIYPADFAPIAAYLKRWKASLAVWESLAITPQVIQDLKTGMRS